MICWNCNYWIWRWCSRSRWAAGELGKLDIVFRYNNWGVGAARAEAVEYCQNTALILRTKWIHECLWSHHRFKFLFNDIIYYWSILNIHVDTHCSMIISSLKLCQLKFGKSTNGVHLVMCLSIWEMLATSPRQQIISIVRFQWPVRLKSIHFRLLLSTTSSINVRWSMS